MSHLLQIRGAIPLLMIVFSNSLIQFGHKIILLSAIFESSTGTYALFLSVCLNLLLLVPFCITFPLSGYIADRFHRSRTLQILAWLYMLLSVLLVVCYSFGLFWIGFAISLLLSIQMAFCLPVRNAYLKDLFGETHLAQANALVQGVQILSLLGAITLFIFVFSFFSQDSSSSSEALHSSSFTSFILLAFCFVGIIFSYKLPHLKTHLAPRKTHFSYYEECKEDIHATLSHPTLRFSIFCIAFFSFVIQLYLTIFPAYVISTFGIENPLFLAWLVFAMGSGIALGSYIAFAFSERYLELGLIPFGLLASLLAMVLLFFVPSFILCALFAFVFGLGGALMMAPLNTLIQFHSTFVGQSIAVSKLFQATGMLSGMGVGFLCVLLGCSTQTLFGFAILAGLGIIGFIFMKMPFLFVRLVMTLTFCQRYRLIVEGFSNLPKEKGALLLGNHISLIDWAIVQMAIPRKIFFVATQNIQMPWYVKFFLPQLPCDPTHYSQIASHLENGDLVCLFPEGTISKHGHLNEFKDDFEKICTLLCSPQEINIIPFYIRGLWGSRFSRSDSQFKARSSSFFLKRNITIAFGEALEIHTTKEKVKNAIFDLSFKAWESQCKAMPTLGRSWIGIAKASLRKTAIIDSINGSFSYHKVLALSLLLSVFLKKHKPRSLQSTSAECVGILLPASFASSLCNLSIFVANKIAVNLNFTAGQKAINSAIQASQIKRIFTSKQFLSKLQDKGIVLEFGEVELLYMEDIVAQIKAQKSVILGYMIASALLPASVLKFIFSRSKNTQSVATILFSSGSEGKPKGIMLNHLNIMSNIAQISDVLCLQDDDAILSSLPPFHAFGLTATTLLPLLSGIPSLTYADPTDALGIAQAVAKNKATIMCGTSTFLGIYARNPKVESLMFESLRIVVSGAEKLKAEVRHAFESKFHRPILEGYGATETTPVVSVNLPSRFDAKDWELHTANKTGSVGMPLPGTTLKIVDPTTMQSLPHGEDGLILVGGHQVMVGYLNDPEKTHEVIVELDGIRWYKTGDKGHLDEDGYLYITDRYSRFAKIGGEMISLGGIEEDIAKILKREEITEDVKFIATALEDHKKGEMIVLLIQTQEQEVFDQITALIKSSNLPAICKPKLYFQVSQIPLLGSGKIDLNGAKKLAKELVG